MEYNDNFVCDFKNIYFKTKTTRSKQELELLNKKKIKDLNLFI